MENDLLKERREKLEKLESLGVIAYGDKPLLRLDIGEAINNFSEGKKLTVAGRLMSIRGHGKVFFADLRDSSAKLQLYIKKDIVGEDKFNIFSLFDIGDIITASGELFKTHTQEITIKVEDLKLLSKSLKPLPEKWHGLKDVETRFRKRHLDLISSPEVREVFLRRTKIVSKIRSFLDSENFMEVETPMLHPIAGGAAGRPFSTHHNEYDINLFLRIAPELYLKKLLVGGFEKIYEINRSFRNEGVSTRHNPEFTMLEVYAAYNNCDDMMELCEELITHAAYEVFGKLIFEYQGHEVDLTRPWKRVSFAKIVEEEFRIFANDSESVMLDKLRAKGKCRAEKGLTRTQIMKIVEDHLQTQSFFSPTFFTDYFTFLCPLAMAKKDNPNISERFELFMGGIEIANAYSELNNPIEQKERFLAELKEDNEHNDRNVDEDFIEALEYGMPPAGGLGIGIDRLVMILTNQPSIREVILFPLLRPEA
ncbi:MAG: lysine--tRNA ligase [Candidatus Omnitrophota bacterium]